MILVFEQDKAVAEWVARRLEHLSPAGFGPCSAIGISDGAKPVAGVVFNDYFEKYSTMQVSIAADTPRWAQRGIICGIFHYPFVQIGVEKLWSCVGSDNKRALKFNKGLGFKQEAILARHFGKEHAIITRMFRKDWAKRWKVSEDVESRAA